MTSLIPEMFIHICRYLDVYDVVSCRRVCRSWNQWTDQDQIWEVFVTVLKIDQTRGLNPKSAVKNFFSISLGTDDALIKNGWSIPLKKKIRSIPYISWEKISNLPAIPGQYYINCDHLFTHITSLTRTIDSTQEICFFLPISNKKQQTIIIKNFKNIEEDYFLWKLLRPIVFTQKITRKLSKINKFKISVSYWKHAQLLQNGTYPSLSQFIENELKENEW